MLLSLLVRIMIVIWPLGSVWPLGMVLGIGAPRDLAEFEPRVDLSMGRKIIEIP